MTYEDASKIFHNVLRSGNELPGDHHPEIRGFQFDREAQVDYKSLFKSYETIGFQATNLDRAIKSIQNMVIIFFAFLNYI